MEHPLEIKIEDLNEFFNKINIKITSQDLETIIEESKKTSIYEIIIVHFVPMIQEELPKTIAQKLQEQKEKKQEEAAKQKIHEEQTRQMNELREKKKILTEEIRKVSEEIQELEKKMRNVKTGWGKKPEKPEKPHMEVKNFLTHWNEQSRPESIEYDLSSEAQDIIKFMGIKISKPSKRGTPVSVDFAESPRLSSPVFEHLEFPYLIQKSVMEIAPKQNEICKTIHENLSKNLKFMSVIRGPFVLSTVTGLKRDVYGIIVTRNKKNDGYDIKNIDDLKENEFYCGVISYSNETIRNFVQNVKKNEIPLKTNTLINESLTPQKRGEY